MGRKGSLLKRGKSLRLRFDEQLSHRTAQSTQKRQIRHAASRWETRDQRGRTLEHSTHAQIEGRNTGASTTVRNTLATGRVLSPAVGGHGRAADDGVRSVGATQFPNQSKERNRTSIH